MAPAGWNVAGGSEREPRDGDIDDSLRLVTLGAVDFSVSLSVLLLVVVEKSVGLKSARRDGFRGGRPTPWYR